MKKDLQSYKKHEAEYISFHTVEYVRNIIATYEKENQFELRGFTAAIKKLKNTETHIDIGCGSGWLLYKTSPFFKRVIGIEPTAKIIEVNKQYIHEIGGLSNVEFINMDMIDGIHSINPTRPVFITTATVLSHIKDFYVKDFLKTVNDLPIGSALFFDERYDKNVQQNMWHIRSKNWWAKNLPDWQLEFFGLENTGYVSGIFGTKLPKGSKINYFEQSPQEKIAWHLGGLKAKKDRLIRFAKRKLKIS
ncbi:MAG: class I SAM-dependent methyltransferase [Patescibacteria group bacterium]